MNVLNFYFNPKIRHATVTVHIERNQGTLLGECGRL